MKNVINRKSSLILVLLVLVLALAACGSGSSNDKDVKVGFIPGPYSDQFKKAIQPILEEKGYKVEVVEFSNAVQPNSSLNEGSLDANIFQNEGYLNVFNNDNKTELTELLKVPTAPLGIYSSTFKSLDELKEGAVISIPNDATNLARALVLLQDAGIIQLKDGVDPLQATEKDVADGGKKVKIEPLDAPQLPRSLSDVDFSVITGNHVIAAGMKLSESLYLEDPASPYQIIAVVNKKDLESDFAKDLKAAYQSEEYKTFIETDADAIGFSKPDYWK